MSFSARNFAAGAVCKARFILNTSDIFDERGSFDFRQLSRMRATAYFRGAECVYQIFQCVSFTPFIKRYRMPEFSDQAFDCRHTLFPTLAFIWAMLAQAASEG